MNRYEKQLQSWISREKQAIALIQEVSRLWYDHSVELVLFRKPLVDQSANQILNSHLYAQQIIEQELTVEVSLGLARAIGQLDLAPSRIDLGKLGHEWLSSGAKDYQAFVADQLKHHIGKNKLTLVPRDVVLYGFGRIGRLAARELISQAGRGEQLRLRAIVTRSNTDAEIIKRAELLRNDSVHGAFKGTITVDLGQKAIIANGHTILMLSAKGPLDIDYTAHEIENALIIDNTGAWRDAEGLGNHLKSKGVAQVLLTAPGKGDIPNIVYGVNHESYDLDKIKIWSAASCTTNAIVPPLKVLNDAIGIEKGHIETVHAYTNDQNLADNFHKKSRRGRAAALNMVITETGAAKAVTKVLPEMSGKLTGNAVRVPTPDVSLAILHLTLKKEVTKDQINGLLKQSALFGSMVEQIDYSINDEMVSTDVIGNSHASVVDGPATIVSPDNKNVVLYVWYDNEYGYTRQVIRLAKHISGVVRLRYY